MMRINLAILAEKFGRIFSGQRIKSILNSEKMPMVMFMGSLIFAAFGTGLYAGMWNHWPAPAMRALYGDIKDLQKHWKNDLGLEASRHLVPAYRTDRERFHVIEPADMPEGYLAVVGLTPDRNALNSVIMYDAQGQEVHTWPVDYHMLDPDGRDPENVFLHGITINDDGSLFINFDAGNVLARLDACGNIIWKTQGHYHHAVSASHDGTIWTLRDNSIEQLHGATGEPIREIKLVQDLMKKHKRQGLMGIRTEENANKIVFSGDEFHANHIEVLTPDLAPAFPQFAVGDLLISFRSLNLVAVLDAKTYDFKWWNIGPWHRQHQPQFTKQGTIVVYNNNMSFGTSDILEIDPLTREVRTVFAGSTDSPFYSYRRGTHQRLENGNHLITESERGRAFIVTPGGRLVWEYNNIYDSDRNGVIARTIHLSKEFFRQSALTCQAPLVTAETTP